MSTATRVRPSTTPDNRPMTSGEIRFAVAAVVVVVGALAGFFWHLSTQPELYPPFDDVVLESGDSLVLDQATTAAALPEFFAGEDDVLIELRDTNTAVEGLYRGKRAWIVTEDGEVIAGVPENLDKDWGGYLSDESEEISIGFTVPVVGDPTCAGRCVELRRRDGVCLSRLRRPRVQQLFGDRKPTVQGDRLDGCAGSRVRRPVRFANGQSSHQDWGRAGRRVDPRDRCLFRHASPRHPKDPSRFEAADPGPNRPATWRSSACKDSGES